MDDSGKNELFTNTESSYFRRAQRSRSVKLNGSSLRHRAPLTLYVPPNRRNSESFENGSISPKTPTKVYNKFKPIENNFDREFNDKNVIMQEINTTNVMTQDIDRNSVTTKNVMTQDFNRNSVTTEDSNQDAITKGFNEQSTVDKFNQESSRPRFNLIQEDFRRININRDDCKQDNISEEFQDVKQRANDEKSVTQKLNREGVVEKVLKLAEPYMNLEFKQILCDMYFDKYKEKLPIECLNAIKFYISIDNSINDFLNAESCIEQDNQEKRFLKDNDYYMPEDSLLHKKEVSKPKVLEVKDLNKEFWIYICNCESFTNISGIINGPQHFDKFEELADQLKTFIGESKPEEVVEENSYYAVFDGSWYRVQCIKCNESTADVLFIDRGDRDNIPIDRLFKLDPKFLELPAQAINMSLSDLEIFVDCDGTHEMLLELLFEKLVYVVVKDLNTEKNYLSVQLYKTEDNQNINVNELLMKRLFETVLNPLNNIKEDTVEHINFIQMNETAFFIQLDTKSLQYFKLLMKVLIEKYCSDENVKRQNVVRFEGNKIYFVKRSRDNKFYRARVCKFKNESTIEVLLIDSGIVTFINRDDFFSLEKLCPVLAQYPAQAIEVQLEQITSHHLKILDHLQALTSNSNELYVKFLKPELGNNYIPIIHLYKKVHDYLVSVNDAILIEHSDILKESKICKSNSKLVNYNFNESEPKSVKADLDDIKSKLTEDNLTIQQTSTKGYFDELAKNSLIEIESLFKKVDCTNLSISGLLSHPIVPRKSYFDVHVAIAKDPSCFVIQLLKSKSVELKKMVHDMRTVYQNYKGPTFTYKSIGVGQMYAYRCEFSSHMWYRVYVLKVKDKNTACVYYCDYGLYKDINIENLICLQDQFYSVPYQAIWAELHGVAPVSGPFWTPEACLKFKELTESKDFVCKVKGIKSVKDLNRRKVVPLTIEHIYVVKLIDTGTDEDLYISDILIRKGQALKKTTIPTHMSNVK